MSSFTGTLMSAKMSLAMSAPCLHIWPISACAPDIGRISPILRLAGAACAEAKRSGNGAPSRLAAAAARPKLRRVKRLLLVTRPSLNDWADYREGRHGVLVRRHEREPG